MKPSIETPPSDDTPAPALSLTSFRSRLIFWGGAVITGLVASLFAYIADDMQALFKKAVEFSQLTPLVLSPLFFALAAWLTAKFCPTGAGSGIPQAIAARQVKTPEERKELLGLRVAAGKILLTALALLGGASIGREGPTVQVGASLLYFAAIAGRMEAEMMGQAILAGAAAGVAAAFNTPLAGIVFAIEEMARAFEYKHSHVVLTAIVFAGAASLSVLGNYSYFGYADGGFDMLRDLPAIGITGMLGGLFGGLFARALTQGNVVFRAFLRKRRIEHPALFAATCGLAIAGIGLLTHGATYGSGYEQAKALLHGETAGSWFNALAKFMATALSGISGIPGGIFSPSLSVGANLGAALAPHFAGLSIAGIVILGMTSYLAGVTQAPITTFIIVLEITGRESMPVALIATALIAAAVSKLICPVSLYHSLAKNFLPKPIHTQESGATVKEVIEDKS